MPGLEYEDEGHVAHEWLAFDEGLLLGRKSVLHEYMYVVVLVWM